MHICCITPWTLCGYIAVPLNMDETGMPLDFRPPKVVVPKGQKVRYRCLGQKSQITVFCCGNATGQTIPPYIIFTAMQAADKAVDENEVQGNRYAASESGWIDQDLFHEKQSAG